MKILNVCNQPEFQLFSKSKEKLVKKSYLYTNTVLDVSVILCVCSFAIETTFPLSNFQTKHIFGILMVLRKYEDYLGRRRRPKVYV